MMSRFAITSKTFSLTIFIPAPLFVSAGESGGVCEFRRDPHRKPAPLTHIALHADGPAQQFRKLLRNRQPQSSALLDAALRPFGLTVFVEDGGEFVGWYSFSSVRDRDD